MRTMLGAVDRDYVYRIVDALAAGDGAGAARREPTRWPRAASPSASALEELASLFHRIAVAQAVPRPPPAIDDARARRGATRPRFAPETVQLAYQICAQGRADLALAPDEATGSR